MVEVRARMRIATHHYLFLSNNCVGWYVEALRMDGCVKKNPIHASYTYAIRSCYYVLFVGQMH